jgi:hypothetical protein
MLSSDCPEDDRSSVFWHQSTDWGNSEQAMASPTKQEITAIAQLDQRP